MDRLLTRVQWIGVAGGLAIALAGAGEGGALSLALRVVGYPVACAAIVRWVPIVRERAVGWFAAHEAAMAAIALGWALTERTGGAVVNGAWFVIAAVWWFGVGLQTSE